MSEISYNSGENCDEFPFVSNSKTSVKYRTEEWSHVTPQMMIILYSTVLCSILIFMNNDGSNTQENYIISVREYM
jgi:hypothetical protein